jgi:hypothetical protein
MDDNIYADDLTDDERIEFVRLLHKYRTFVNDDMVAQEDEEAVIACDNLLGHISLP